MMELIPYGADVVPRGIAYQKLINVAKAQGHDDRQAKAMADRWMQGYDLRLKLKKQNPQSSSDEMYKSFHGEPSDETLEKKWRMRLADHRGNPKQKWLLPFKRGKKNYEDVGYLPYALGHDIGFSGNKMYRPVKYENGTITVMSSDLAREQYDTYSRKSVMDAIKRLADGKSNPKRNPQSSSDDMYASFHGEPSDETLEIDEEEHYHSHLASLGELVEIKVKLHVGENAGIESDDWV